jgi:hypothetical protein
VNSTENPERDRVAEADSGVVPWRHWGPYLSERQWGTEREDYSEGRDADLYAFYGDDLKVECSTGSGRELNLEVAEDLSDRIMGIFLRDSDGRRPVHGGEPMLQEDHHFRDLLLFYEYFHGDNGAGIGPFHQTGWSGCVGVLPLLPRLYEWGGPLAGGGGAPAGSAKKAGA